MAEIRPLRTLDEQLLHELIVGYTSPARYEVTKVESPEYTRIELRLVQLEQPFVKHYPEIDEATAQRYYDIVAQGSSFGVFADERCVGIALAEPQNWNSTLFLHELHLAPEFQGRGLGRQLLETVVAQARSLGMRAVAFETQTTNVPAIQFYRALGFAVEGIDLSFYTNHDSDGGEVALFMRKALDE